MSRPPIPELAGALAGAMWTLDGDDQALALAIYRRLARGRPVAAGDLAAALAREVAGIETALERRAGVFRDEEGRIVSFWGLAIAETAHRLRVDGRTLYAWCAWDALFLPALIGRPAEVTSRSPASGEPIRLTLSADALEEACPPATVVSMLLPSCDFDDSVCTDFCHYVHFFSSSADAEPWLAEHTETFLVSLEEAFELGRLTNAAKFPELSRGAAAAGGGG